MFPCNFPMVLSVIYLSVFPLPLGYFPSPALVKASFSPFPSSYRLCPAYPIPRVSSSFFLSPQLISISMVSEVTLDDIL